MLRLSEAEFLRIAEINIAALNAATADLPSDKVTKKHIFIKRKQGKYCEKIFCQVHFRGLHLLVKM